MNKLIGAIAVSATAIAVQAQVPAPPVESVNAWYDFLLRWVMEPVIGACLLGFFASIVITQRWKMTLPDDLSNEARRRKTQWFSFYVGFVVTLLFWPLGWTKELTEYGVRGIYLILVSGGVAAVIVGALAPFVYAVVMNQLYKFGWFNEVKWSGQARAEAKLSGTDQPGQ
jgi:hypothetical protein